MRYLAILAILLFPAVASAQYMVTGFEQPDYVGSPEGTLLTYGYGGGGQQGWYNPVAGCMDWNVFTYAGNAFGFPENPYGEDQFIGGVTDGTYARAQYDFPFEDTAYTASFDVCAGFLGTAPTTQNLGSFSLQPSATARSWQNLYTWVDLNNPTTWNAWYLCYDAGGTQWPQPGLSPGAAWDNLPINHWYRQSTTWDFVTNMVTSVYIKDLTTGDESWYYPTDWYLAGGETGGGRPLATGFRYFVGGTVYGNALGIDNLEIIPEPGMVGLVAAGLLGAFALRRRR